MMDRRGKLGMMFVAAAWILAICPAVSHAQSFGFSIASGGGHHHHHHGGGGWWAGYGVGPYWGPGWGPGWYGPPPIIYAPPPVVQPSVIYVQPPAAPLPPGPSPYSATSSPPTALASNNILPSTPTGNASDDRIVIRNTAGAQLPVSFLVDSQDVELPDGATRTFVGKARRTIQYDRGGRFGSTQQDLTGGQYEFRVTATGWDLARKTDTFSASRTAVKANSLPDSGVSR
jgi:hypothetical protein